jgi:hypothetical protein
MAMLSNLSVYLSTLSVWTQKKGLPVKVDDVVVAEAKKGPACQTGQT